MITPIWNPQSPYLTPFSGFIWYLVRKLRRNPYYNRFRGRSAKPASMEARQEESAMKGTEDCKKRDVRAVQWLVRHLQSKEISWTRRNDVGVCAATGYACTQVEDWLMSTMTGFKGSPLPHDLWRGLPVFSLQLSKPRIVSWEIAAAVLLRSVLSLRQVL